MLRRCLVPPAALPVFEATARTVNILGLLFAYEGNNLRKTLNNLCFIMTAAGTNHRFQRSVYDRVTELGKIDRVAAKQRQLAKAHQWDHPKDIAEAVQEPECEETTDRRTPASGR